MKHTIYCGSINGLGGAFMLISGLQKLTLLDFPDKTACTVFAPGCNLRCPFCHNASLVRGPFPPFIDEKELFDFLGKRAGILDGVCITGGEPLLQKDIIPFIKKIRSLGFSVKLDTNGTLPEVLEELLRSSLVDYVAMDIKSSPEGYAAAVGIKDFDYSPIQKSISLLLSGDTDYEFRTTVVKGVHSEKEILGAAQSIKGAKRYFLQQFVDSGDILSTGCLAFSAQEMRELLKLVSPFALYSALRGVD